jgi:hypothetical protein
MKRLSSLRKRCPDWLFWPGVNAVARLKFKDGGGGGTTRRGRAQAKDPLDRGGGEDDEPGAEVEDLGYEEMRGKPKERQWRSTRAEDEDKMETWRDR